MASRSLCLQYAGTHQHHRSSHSRRAPAAPAASSSSHRAGVRRRSQLGRFEQLPSLSLARARTNRYPAHAYAARHTQSTSRNAPKALRPRPPRANAPGAGGGDGGCGGAGGGDGGGDAAGGG